MKKFFALVLAVAMIMSMSAVSFADFNVAGPLDYSNDSKAMSPKELYEYGDTVFFRIEAPEDTNAIAKKAYYEKLKVATTIEMGEEIVENVSVVKKADQEGANYYIAVKLAKKTTIAETDVVGSFEINRKEVKADAAKGITRSAKVEDQKFDFGFTVFYDAGQTFIGDARTVKGDMTLDYDEDYALKFDNDDEVTFTFGDGSDANEGEFTVDVSGQGKVYLKLTTKADEAIVAANEGVEMFFVNFNNVKFNRAGEFVYDYEDGVAAYKVVDGALVEIPGLEVDDGEFSFRTNVLGNYVFAKAELVNPVVAAPVVEAPAVTNPTTGA